MISIIAASRYFGTLRTILIATRRPYSGAAGAEGPEGEGGAYAAHTEREREREREREGGREGEFGWADLLFIVTADHRPESTCSTAHGEQSERVRRQGGGVARHLHPAVPPLDLRRTIAARVSAVQAHGRVRAVRVAIGALAAGAAHSDPPAARS